MENSQLIFIIKALDKAEIRELRKWLASPFHNQREDVCSLFDYLTTSKHLDDAKFLKKERVFSKVFPKVPYDDARLRQSMHFLLKAIEDYLTYQALIQDESSKKLALARIYRHKKLEKPYSKTIKSLEKLQQHNTRQDEKYHLSSYQIEFEKYRFISEQKRSATSNLQEVANRQELSAISGQLRIACLMLSHKNIFKTTYDYGNLPGTLAYIQDKKLYEVPAISPYYHYYKAMTEPEEEHYQNFRSAIFEHEDKFQHTDSRDLYLLALNYCIARINEGVQLYLEEAFVLYDRGIKSGAFIENDILDPRTFRNAITAAMNLRKFDWVESFIKENAPKLPDSQRATYVNLSLAQLFYTKKNYTKAQQLLLQVPSDDVLINLNAKWILIRIYYEEGEYQLLESLLESMKTYISRKKALANHKDIYNNLIRFTRRLIRVNPYDKEAVQKLKKSIEEAPSLISKSWFMQQLEEL